MSPAAPPEPETVVLDLDGTLVDSVYAHVLAWRSVFADLGVDVPAVRLHRAIGLGGDKLVAHVAGDDVERSSGDEARAMHPQHLDRFFPLIGPTPGATEMLRALREAGRTVVLASSSDRELTERLVDLVPGAADLLQQTTTGSDAEESKPSGEVVEVALHAVDAGTSLLVGDAVWDVHSAQDAGVPCLGVLTGGITEAALREAGAVDVVGSPADLVDRLHRTGRLLGDADQGRVGD